MCQSDLFSMGEFEWYIFRSLETLSGCVFVRLSLSKNNLSGHSLFTLSRLTGVNLFSIGVLFLRLRKTLQNGCKSGLESNGYDFNNMFSLLVDQKKEEKKLVYTLKTF